MSDKSDKMSDGHMKDYRITVRFPPELHRRLKAAARRSGTRESELVRGAVELQLALEEDSLTAYEHAKKAGLIGAVKGTARDLSSNPVPSWPSCWNPTSTMQRVSSNFISSGVPC